jgi:hypothetical protein
MVKDNNIRNGIACSLYRPEEVSKQKYRSMQNFLHFVVQIKGL